MIRIFSRILVTLTINPGDTFEQITIFDLRVSSIFLNVYSIKLELNKLMLSKMNCSPNNQLSTNNGNIKKRRKKVIAVIMEPISTTSNTLNPPLTVHLFSARPNPGPCSYVSLHDIKRWRERGEVIWYL